MQRAADDRAGTERARKHVRPLRWLPLTVLSLGLLAAVVLAAGVGSVAISPGQVVRAIEHGLAGRLAGPLDTIVWQLRLPRVLLSALVGGALALAGVAYQGVFRNPLADPYLLGVASGAGFGASLVLVFGAALPVLVRLGLPLVAFAFALGAVALVMLLAQQGGRLPIISLILAGVVVGSSLSAATSFVLLLAREQAAGVLAWLLGSFAFASWERVLAVLLFMLPATLVMLASARALDLLQLGEESAMHLGLPSGAFKLGLVTVATLVTAAAVAVSGIIGFVGLIMPHAARLAFGPGHRRLIPLSVLLGALFLVLADLVARTLIAPGELPIGVVTALVGGPFFLWLLRRGRPGS
ncbi:MAG TPA: iron ABC transporter permease [Trueperaceae bacterium]